MSAAASPNFTEHYKIQPHSIRTHGVNLLTTHSISLYHKKSYSIRTTLLCDNYRTILYCFKKNDILLPGNIVTSLSLSRYHDGWSFLHTYQVSLPEPSWLSFLAENSHTSVRLQFSKELIQLGYFKTFCATDDLHSYPKQHFKS